MIKWYDRIGNPIEMKLFLDADCTEFEWVKGRVISGYRYQDGIVSMASENERVIWCGVDSGCYRKCDDSLGDLITQADRIRSMNDEELAEFIPVAFDMCCSPTKECMENYMIRGECTKTHKCVLQWLKSEVKE